MTEFDEKRAAVKADRDLWIEAAELVRQRGHGMVDESYALRVQRHQTEYEKRIHQIDEQERLASYDGPRVYVVIWNGTHGDMGRMEYDTDHVLYRGEDRQKAIETARATLGQWGSCRVEEHREIGREPLRIDWAAPEFPGRSTRYGLTVGGGEPPAVGWSEVYPIERH
jgi:hypothetical protein